jgi:peptidyl-dipeptidase Dcp
MDMKIVAVFVAVLALCSLGCRLAAAEETTGNPALAEWTGPYGGLPPFDKVRLEHLKPALEQGMAEQLRAVEAIAADPAPATFENTLAAMERSGRGFERAHTFYGIWSSLLSTPEFQALEREMAPKLAAFGDKINQNEKLFRRIETVYKAREALADPEQRRLAWKYYTDFVRSGAALDAAGKKRVAGINERMASLFASFNQNVLGEESDRMLVVEKKSDLKGLPAPLIAAAAASAAERGHKGKWLILNTRSSVEPFLTYTVRRDLREKVWRAFIERGDNGNERDNNAAIKELLALRAGRAALLGYATHAHWRVENTMAGSPEKATELMETVWPPAIARVKEEVADMLAIAAKADNLKSIEPWDYRYYAEKVRKAKYDLDESEIKPYLQIEKVREAMFWVAGELLDLHFTPAEAPVYHPDVRVWQVKDGAGKHAGLWYFDPWARPGKKSGAWKSSYRTQARFDGEVPTIVSNNLNCIKGAPGSAVLVSWDDASTMFHEFGHALHGLSSNVSYPSLSGTAVARDYVEFPSQVLEHWLRAPEVLARFAVHYKTGKPMPGSLIEKIQRAEKFNMGFTTVEYLASAIVDMKVHLTGGKDTDPKAFEKSALGTVGMPREMVMRHRMPHFSHIFGSDSYSAGYYSYLWADTLSADAYAAFTEGSGPFDKAVAAKLKKYVFSAGNTVDPAEAYRAFRGRDPGISALMAERGFPLPGAVGK